MKTIQTLYDEPKKRRVVIFEREDGSFGFEHQRFSEEPLEMAWIPFGQDCRCDTPERALAEARGRVAWLGEKDSRDENTKA